MKRRPLDRGRFSFRPLVASSLTLRMPGHCTKEEAAPSHGRSEDRERMRTMQLGAARLFKPLRSRHHDRVRVSRCSTPAVARPKRDRRGARPTTWRRRERGLIRSRSRHPTARVLPEGVCSTWWRRDRHLNEHPLLDTSSTASASVPGTVRVRTPPFFRPPPPRANATLLLQISGDSSASVAKERPPACELDPNRQKHRPTATTHA